MNPAEGPKAQQGRLSTGSMDAESAGVAAGPSTCNPPAIIRLDENVVNKIAAGEVIQRPASALKEMLENSLDAGSTQISILVKEGGNKLLQITDNGTGIRKEDLPILCHRHTTSKLREYEDLETISTLGFRGEALCSITFVSHMSVTTMARGAQYGYRVTYKDSAMQSPGPRPVASVPGTTITVEDLFYNVPTRRKALKSASEEYGLILDVVGRYAVYSTGVAFSCRRQGDARPDISTTVAACRVDAVRSVYGADVARELLALKAVVGGCTGPEVPVNGPMGLSVEGLISGANYSSGKKTVLVLFINGRCVECSQLRRSLEALYGTLLPKACRPWMFLDVRLPPRQVEVNMHPTKREVGFMHQAEVIDEIRRVVEAKLLDSNESRTFATLQTKLPFASLPLSRCPSQPSLGDRDTGGGEAAALGNEDAEERVEEGEGDDGMGETEKNRKEEEPAGKRPRCREVAVAPARASSGQELQRPATAAAGAVPYRPEKLVRVDYRSGSLDTFVVASKGANAGDAAILAAAARGSVARRRSATGRISGLENMDATVDVATGRLQARAAKSLPPGLVTAEILGLGPFAGTPLENLEGHEPGPLDAVEAGAGPARVTARRAPPPLVTSDPAVLALWSEVEVAAHAGLADLLREHTFVGMADGSLALLQHGTKLYLVDVGLLSSDMFYQLALRRWEQPLCVALEPPPLVSELVALGLQLLQVKGEWQPEDGSPEELGELVTELLQQNGPELELQLGLTVDPQGRLRSVPLLLEGLCPDPARLPDLVVALAKDVDWDQPKERVRTLATVVANLYTARPPLLPEENAGQRIISFTSATGVHTATPGDSRRNSMETGSLGTSSPGGLQEYLHPDAGARSKSADGERVGQGRGRDGAGIAGRGDECDVDSGAGAWNALEGERGRQRGASLHEGEDEESTGEQDDGGRGQTERTAERSGLHVESQELQQAIDQTVAAYEFQVKHIILPAMRGSVKPPKHRAMDGSCVQVAALERLYRIFERC